MGRTRVLFHVHALGLGGAERQLSLLVEGLAHREIEPHVVTLYPGGAVWDTMVANGKVPVVSLGRKGRWDFSVVRALARYVTEHSIELIQGWMPPANSFAAAAGRISRRPVVLGIRASNWRFPRPSAGAYLILDGILGRCLASAIVCNSERGRRFHARVGYPRRKMVSIPNGVALPAACRPKEPFAHKPPWRLGMLARLDPMKDHPTMLRALRLLIERNIPVSLSVWGGGAGAYRERLVSMADHLGLATRVNWCGTATDPWAALSEVDILCCPSSHGEGTSNAILEGMAAGRVVVATDVGDAKHLLAGESGTCGVIVRPHDPEGLAGAIQTILADTALALRHAGQAREAARLGFTPDAMVQRYADLYAAILRGGDARRWGSHPT